MAVMLNSSRNTNIHKAKSHTSIYDIFSPTRQYNASCLKYKKTCTYHEVCDDPQRKYAEVKGSIPLYLTPYITSEKYHSLNKRTSDKYVVRSTSTLFYDLDNLAKRHSYDCVADFGVSTHNISLGSTKRSFTNSSGFDAKSKAIVQECTTKTIPKDSVSLINKKTKKSTPSKLLISSDLFINSTDYTEKGPNIQLRFNEKDQKFWSYSKYKTEYTKPISEERRNIIKNHGQNSEDPCPCQLFSYACPCTDKKSLTNLAKNNKTATASNQVTTSMKVAATYKNKTMKENSRNLVDKVTSPQVSEILPEYKVVRVSDQISPQSVYHKNMSKHICNEIRSNCCPKQKTHRKSRQVICPKCKERIEIMSIGGEEDNLCNSHTHQVQENSSPDQHSYASNISQKSKFDGDMCNHEPPCELVPICQILPSEQAFAQSAKCFKMESKMKNNSRTIKITKACRHHPPCTVVPSCQRIRVLNSNCEYIPPCLHRPRCVNLPLCVPFSKTIDYDELLNNPVNEEDSLKCHHMYSTPAYMPVYQHETVANNIQHQFHATQNNREYVNNFDPTFFLTPKLTRTSPTFSPNQSPTNKPSPISCTCPKSNKSCQYQCADCRCENITSPAKKSPSEDVIVYIRDVGCQFRNKHSSYNNILQSKTSSGSFEDDTAKMGNYFSNYHTLRYEDKFTNPVSGGEQTTISTSSIEVDSHCPSHGKDRNLGLPEINTGFRARTSPVVANCSLQDSILKYCASKDLNKKRKKTRSISNTTSSRKIFVKSKHEKSSVKRRRKSRLSYQNLLNSNSRF